MGISTGTPCCGCSNFDPPTCDTPCAFNWNGCSPSATGDIYDLYDYALIDPITLIRYLDWDQWYKDQYENCGWGTDEPAIGFYDSAASVITGSDGDFFWPAIRAQQNNLFRHYAFDYRDRQTLTIDFDVQFGGWDDLPSFSAFTSIGMFFGQPNPRLGTDLQVCEFSFYDWPSVGPVAELRGLGIIPLPTTDVFNFKLTQTLTEFEEPFDSAVFMVLPPNGREQIVPSCAQIVICEYQMWIDGDLVTHPTVGTDIIRKRRLFFGAKCYDNFTFSEDQDGTLIAGPYAVQGPSMTTSNMSFTVS